MQSLQLKVPPLLLVLIFAGGMWASAVIWPEHPFELPFRMVITSLIGGLGGLLALLGVLAFRKAQTTVDPRVPGQASELVTSGVYRYTRNPMYLGFLLGLLAWAIFLSQLWAFMWLPLFVLYMNVLQIGPEERIIAEMFGADFERYRRRVRRWI